jgi:hypothetical protein
MILIITLREIFHSKLHNFLMKNKMELQKKTLKSMQT